MELPVLRIEPIRTKDLTPEDEANRFPQVYPCGECTACCETTGVEELGKPYYRKCEHLTEKGCGIYGNHPKSCKGYMCLWSMGIFGNRPDLRPDRIGFVAEPSQALGRDWMDVYFTRPLEDEKQTSWMLTQLLQCLAMVQSVFATIWGIRIFKYNTNWGCLYEIDQEKYPTDISKWSPTFGAIPGTDNRILIHSEVAQPDSVDTIDEVPND